MSTDQDGVPDDRDHGGVAFQWSCPICGQMGVTFTVEKASKNLLAHMRGTDGRDHGPRKAYPTGMDSDTIEQSTFSVR